MSVNARCESEYCHRETEWLAEFPSADHQEMETRACCTPCLNMLILGTEISRSEFVHRRYQDTDSGCFTEDAEGGGASR